MKHLKTIFWVIKNAISFSPVLFAGYIGVQIMRATLVLFVTISLGDVINAVQDMFTTEGDIYAIAYGLLKFGLLNVLLWLLVEVKWRFSDDYMPVRGEVGASKFLIEVSRMVPLRDFDNADFCDKFYRFCDGIRSQPGILRSYIGVFITVYSLIISLVYIARFHIIFVPVFIAIFVCGMFIVRNAGEYENEAWRKASPHNRYAGYLSGMFFGIYNREARMMGLCDKHISEWADERRTADNVVLEGSKKAMRVYAVENFLCSTFGPICLLGIAAAFVIRGALPLGCVYTIWGLSRDCFSGAGDVIESFFDCISMTKRSEEVYDTYQEILSHKKTPCKSALLADENKPAIEIKDLSFSYSEGKNVLHDIDLTIQSGVVIALLGENGSGKSTLIKLILGMYTPEAGSVKIFGNDADRSEEYVRGQIGALFQDFCKYPFTLRENVGFGNVEELGNDEKILESLKSAQAESILEDCGSLDRILGRTIESDGTELSGGQWQRLAMARAFFANRKIMIFDEPAAKLDPLAEEKQFAEVIENTRKCGGTVILVSHRVGFARKADRIVFLKNGNISESGTHEELMKKDSDYRVMFEAQRELYAANTVLEVEKQ